MRRLMLFIFALFLVPALAAGTLDERADPYAVAGSFIVLSYHEVRDDVRDYPDPYAVDTAALVKQFAWLRGNGYTPVTLDQIVAARAGGKALPGKAVLLTFDDAYLSFYIRVYPLLREFGFPALLAVVGKWIDDPGSASVAYGEKGGVADRATAANFTTWSQLREMADSGLVELASHTHDLHRGVPANPQANLEPAATAHIYAAASNRYESQATWRARVGADLVRNVEHIARQTGHRPRAVVWPYGSYNDDLTRLTTESGIVFGLTLDDGVNTPDVPLTALRRTLVEHNPSLADFVVELRGPPGPEPIRVVALSLDTVFSADPLQQERNLSTLLERIARLRPTHVYLQATSNDADGFVAAAYFPNRHLPMRADLFNRAAWQLASRVDVKVFAVLPVSAFHLSADRVAEVYEDLALHASFDGLVFDDHLPAGQVSDGETLEFTQQLARRVRALRAPLPTVGTLRVDAAPQSCSGARATPGLAAFAAAYDDVALLASPSSGEALNAAAWLCALGESARPAVGKVASKLIVLLRAARPVAPGDVAGRAIGQVRAQTEGEVMSPLARTMRDLQLAGVLNFGYVDDDLVHDEPPLAQIAPVMSLRVYPQKQVAKGRK